MEKVRVIISGRQCYVAFVVADQILVVRGGKHYEAYKVLNPGPSHLVNKVRIFTDPELQRIWLDPKLHSGWTPKHGTTKWAIAASFRNENKYSSVETVRLV